jgi:hypothetical protein
MKTEFEPIFVRELDSKRTLDLQFEHDRKLTCFRLNKIPTQTWTEYFHSHRKQLRDELGIRAWVERDCIVIDCAPEQAQKHYDDCLRDDIGYANSYCAAQINATDFLQEQKRRENELKVKTLQEIAGKMKF